MLQINERTDNLIQPLVTNMGLNYKAIVSAMAAKILSHETAEMAANEMYDAIEDGLQSDKTSEAGKKFWEDVIAEMLALDNDFATEISKNYFKMVMNNYLPPKP